MSLLMIVFLVLLLIGRILFSAYKGQNYRPGRSTQVSLWVVDAAIALLVVLYLGILTGRILTLVVPMS